MQRQAPPDKPDFVGNSFNKLNVLTFGRRRACFTFNRDNLFRFFSFLSIYFKPFLSFGFYRLICFRSLFVQVFTHLQKDKVNGLTSGVTILIGFPVIFIFCGL